MMMIRLKVVCFAASNMAGFKPSHLKDMRICVKLDFESYPGFGLQNYSNSPTLGPSSHFGFAIVGCLEKDKPELFPSNSGQRW